MSTEHNLQAARQIIEEAFNKQNFAVLEPIFHPNYVEHQFGLRKDIEGLKSDIAFLHKAFPDLHLTIEELDAVGDKVWMRLTARGTNLGGLMGPANGKSFEIAVFDLLRFDDNGLIVDHWGSPDRFAQLAQLDLLPKPAARAQA